MRRRFGTARSHTACRPFTKDDLFRGGVPTSAVGEAAFVESLRKQPVALASGRDPV